MTRGEIEGRGRRAIRRRRQGNAGASRAGQGAGRPGRVRGRRRRPPRDDPRESLHGRRRASQRAARRGRAEPAEPGRGPRPRSGATRCSATVAEELNLEPEKVADGLFADLRDENRMLSFEDMTAQRLIDRYNVALAQAVLLRSVRVDGRGPQRDAGALPAALPPAEVPPAALPGRREHERRLQLPHRRPAEPLQRDDQVRPPDGAFPSALLHCRDFRLDAELRGGRSASPGASISIAGRPDLAPGRHRRFTSRPRSPRSSSGSARLRPPGNCPRHRDPRARPRRGLGSRLPARPQRVRDSTSSSRSSASGRESSLERLLRLASALGPPRFVLAISDKLKVDEEAINKLPSPILRFKEIPSAPELAGLLGRFLKEPDGTANLF